MSVAECEPAIRLGCRNKDRCNLAALGMPSDEGGGGAVPSTGKKKKKKKKRKVCAPASG